MSSLSDHYFYSDNYYLFSNYPLLLDHLPTPMSSSDGSSDSTAMHGGEVPIISFSNNNNNSITVGDLNNNISSSSLVLPFEYSPDISSSPASMAALLGPRHQQRHGAGVSSNNHLMTYSALHDHYEHRDIWDNNNYQMAATGGVYEVGEECSSGGGGGGRLDSSNFWPPVYPIMTRENCIDEGGENGMGEGQRVEDSTLKIASRYSAEERKDRIIRYLKKRSQRNFNKTIKYACRKTLADKRVRVRGRFAKNNELSDDDHQTSTLATNTTTDPDDHIVDHLRHQDHQQSFYTTTTNDLSLLQMKPPSEEEWLQEAIASLMYHRVLPDVQLFH